MERESCVVESTPTLVYYKLYLHLHPFYLFFSTIHHLSRLLLLHLLYLVYNYSTHNKRSTPLLPLPSPPSSPGHPLINNIPHKESDIVLHLWLLLQTKEYDNYSYTFQEFCIFTDFQNLLPSKKRTRGIKGIHKRNDWWQDAKIYQPTYLLIPKPSTFDKLLV